jgi:SAM-dependent methyltransferase
VGGEVGPLVSCDCCGSDDWHYRFTEFGHDLGQCQKCNLYYLRVMPGANESMTLLEDSHFSSGPTLPSARSQQRAEMARAREFRSFLSTLEAAGAHGGRLLDIGCGTGVFMKFAKDRGYHVDGIELSHDRASFARSWTGGTVYEQPLELLNLPAGSFDVVTGINVFSHLTSPSATLAEICRVLRPGGHILLHTGIVGEQAQKRHLRTWGLGDHLSFLGIGTLDRYARKVGLTIEIEQVELTDATIYTRETFLVPGRSAMRNLIKTVLAYTPGAIRLLRWRKLRHPAPIWVLTAILVNARPSPALVSR